MSKNISNRYIRLDSIIVCINTLLVLIIVFPIVIIENIIMRVFTVFMVILIGIAIHFIKIYVYKRNNAQIYLDSRIVYVYGDSLYVQTKKGSLFKNSKGFSYIVPFNEISNIKFVMSIKIGFIYHHLYEIHFKQQHKDLENPMLYANLYLASKDPVSPKSVVSDI
ncbi:hypothetical protein [Neisseria sp. Ec49-e6-T10]|uniref:hypothetical protein n=1 Tax=Neisseria sp. Ec49-e6-T10 TaxID=3140744 RepID=UPI003EBF796F